MYHNWYSAYSAPNRSAKTLPFRDEIDGLIDDPRPHGCEKLSGHEGLYRVRVGDHRVVYAVFDSVVLVLVLKIGNRAEVYERLRESDLAFVRQYLRDAGSP
ncbi:MAG: type II toxin-antitoxin system RelE family toxin [Thermoleophilia bacterium]